MSEADLIRIAIALAPREPLFSAVIHASQEITQRYDNANVIDAVTYPPHVSLHICYIPRRVLEVLLESVSHLATGQSHALYLRGLRVERGSKGYVSVRVSRDTELQEMHQLAISAAASVRDGISEPLPRSFDSYSELDKANYRKYGNAYVGAKFDPHISIAKVEPEDQGDAYAIAKHILDGVTEAPVEALQVCDIGPNNEKWEVLTSAPLPS